MSDIVYCCHCKFRDDCERSEFCGCCGDGEEWEDEDGDEVI